MRNYSELNDKFHYAHIEESKTDEDSKSEDESIEETINIDTSSDELMNKYRKDIEHLKKQLYEANRQAQEEHKKLEKLETERESERQEVIDLRDYIFSLEQSDEPIPEEDHQIPLPYTVTNRIVVFGGHETWIKAIKDMVTGVRWIDRCDVVRPDIIRNADVVFVQSNAVSHKMFYSIENNCKKSRVKMRYCCSSLQKSVPDRCGSRYGDKP